MTWVLYKNFQRGIHSKAIEKPISTIELSNVYLTQQPQNRTTMVNPTNGNTWQQYYYNVHLKKELEVFLVNKHTKTIIFNAVSQNEYIFFPYPMIGSIDDDAKL